MNDNDEIFWKTIYNGLCRIIGCLDIEIGYKNALCAITGYSLHCFWPCDNSRPVNPVCVSNGVGNYRNIVEAIFNVLKTNDISVNGKILKNGLTFEQTIIEEDLNG